MPKIKGIRGVYHPDLYAEMEKIRKAHERKGVRATQLDIGKAIAARLRDKRGVIGYARKKTKRLR